MSDEPEDFKSPPSVPKAEKPKHAQEPSPADDAPEDVPPPKRAARKK